MANAALRTLGTAALGLLVTASVATAQSAPGEPSQTAVGGWVLTPSLLVSSSWDDNPLVRGRGDDVTSDLVNVVNPRASLNFNGRRGQLGADYDGAFLLYRDLGTLNSYDQHGDFSARRLVSPHVALFARDGIAVSPTTEVVQLVGVPFERTGSTVEDAQAGVEAALTKRTSLVATYRFQVVRFDETQPVADFLQGGHSHGGTLALRHALSERLVLVADYDMQHAVVGQAGDVFDVQNADAGLDYRLSSRAHLVGAIGVSHLDVSAVAPGRTGPSWRAGLTEAIQRGEVGVSYARSYVPSFGFGGTVQNEEVSGHAGMQLTRTFYIQSSLAWRRNQALFAGELNLDSLWLQGTVGYRAAPWAHIEVFYDGTHQTIDRPGGVINRNRVGIQIITTKPTRIR